MSTLLLEKRIKKDAISKAGVTFFSENKRGSDDLLEIQGKVAKIISLSFTKPV